MAKTNLSPEEQSKIVGHVNTWERDIRTATTNLRSVWLELYLNYRTFKAKDKKAWQAKLWIPKTFTIIEQIASRTTAHNPKFTLKALQASALQFFTANQKEIDEAIATQKDGEDTKDTLSKETPEPEIISSRDILEAYLIYVFTEKKLKQKIRLWDKGRLIYGTYHVKIDVDIITETRIRTEKGIEGKGDKEVTEEVFKNVLPDINTVDVFDFLIHPQESDLDTAYAVGHKRDETNINELDDDTYFNLGKISPSRSTTNVPEEVVKDNVIAQDSTKKINPNSFKTVEYWGKYTLTGKPEDEKEYIITVANESILIRFEESLVRDANGEVVRPFVAMHDQPIPGEYFAIGEAESVMSLQDEVNHIRNTRVDFNNSVLYPEWIVRKGAGVNPFQLIHKPNNIIQAENVNDVVPLKKETVPQSGYREEEFLNRDFQDTTSTTNFAQPGASSAFTDTASGAKQRREEQNTRMRLKIEYLDDAISQLGKKILIYAADAIADSIEIPKDDDNFVTIYKDAFKKMASGFSPQVVSGSMAADTPSEKRNEAIARGNISMQYQGLGVPINLTKEYEHIMTEGFGVTDTSTLLTAPPPVDPNAQPPGPGGPAPQTTPPPANPLI